MSENKLFDQGPSFRMSGALFAGFDTLKRGLEAAEGDEKCACAVSFRSNDEGDQDQADYSARLARLRYFLLYGYGYAYEYKLMWEDLLEDMGEGAPVNVLSLGCGNGIDFWALRSVLALRHDLKRRRRYIGVDYADWSDCSIGFIQRYDSERGSCYRWGQDAAKYLASQQALDDGALKSNVVVFPKSLGEMDEQVVGKIADTLAEMSRDHALYLCVCPPHGSEDMGLWRDEDAVREKIETLLRAAAGDADLEPLACGEEHGSDAYISQLTAEEWWGHLNERAESSFGMLMRRDLCSCCQQDPDHCSWMTAHAGERECPLQHSPITKGKYPCYHIYRISRR